MISLSSMMQDMLFIVTPGEEGFNITRIIIDLLPTFVAVGGFWIVINNFKRELKNNKHIRVYEIKLNAIIDALSFIDTYLSWLTMSSNVVPVREDITKIKLTSQARNCYNLLCSTCDSNEIVDCWNKIIFNKEEDKVFEHYIEFRDCARKELGLSDIKFDKDKVFYSCISTVDLENK